MFDMKTTHCCTSGTRQNVPLRRHWMMLLEAAVKSGSHKWRSSPMWGRTGVSGWDHNSALKPSDHPEANTGECFQKTASVHDVRTCFDVKGFVSLLIVQKLSTDWTTRFRMISPKGHYLVETRIIYSIVRDKFPLTKVLPAIFVLSNKWETFRSSWDPGTPLFPFFG